MEAKTILRFVRIAPRKARRVVDLIRGKSAEEAFTILKFTPRRGATIVEKVLKSAVANASQKEMGDVDVLTVSKVCVDGGPTMKRMRPRAMGRANTILKRTSHITLVLSGKEVAKKDRKVASAPGKPKKVTPAKKAAAPRKSAVSGKKVAPKKGAAPKKEAASRKENASKKAGSPGKEATSRKSVAPIKAAPPKKKKDANSQKEK